MTDMPTLTTPLTLPNGVVLKNRIIKSAMSDALGDGRGNPTPAQVRLYERWAEGGAAALIVGEVQGDPRFPESPGNLLLDARSDVAAFTDLARRGSAHQTRMWLQLGHAGALTPPDLGTPMGPSALDLPELRAADLPVEEIRALPARFAETARRAEGLGFAGVQIHAAHGFLLSQFLSPLFNRRGDRYGGNITNRLRLVLEVVEAVRAAVSPGMTVTLKLNASDQLSGGLTVEDSLQVAGALDGRGLDLLDISGGTYFPGAPASSDRVTSGPYFLDYARAARARTAVPLMATGGFKRRVEAAAALAEGVVDAVGLARALVLDPALPMAWLAEGDGPDFPRFPSPAPPGGVTAWYTRRLRQIGEERDLTEAGDLPDALEVVRRHDIARNPIWKAR